MIEIIHALMLWLHPYSGARGEAACWLLHRAPDRVQRRVCAVRKDPRRCMRSHIPPEPHERSDRPLQGTPPQLNTRLMSRSSRSRCPGACLSLFRTSRLALMGLVSFFRCGEAQVAALHGKNPSKGAGALANLL